MILAATPPHGIGAELSTAAVIDQVYRIVQN
jgi:hypothetical protein